MSDDFVITGDSQELLDTRVKPAVVAFLAERGLELSAEKTRITRIEDGFDFLGQTLQRYGRKLLIRPSLEAVRSIRSTLAETLRKYRGWFASAMVVKLNSQIRGWAYFHRYVASADTFVALDSWLFRALKKWARRRHPNKGPRWLHETYWSQGDKGWFAALVKTKKGHRLHQLLRFTSIGIVRHVKVRTEANWFDPAWDTYFEELKAGKKRYPAKSSHAEMRAVLACAGI